MHVIRANGAVYTGIYLYCKDYVVIANQGVITSCKHELVTLAYYTREKKHSTHYCLITTVMACIAIIPTSIQL